MILTFDKMFFLLKHPTLPVVYHLCHMYEGTVNLKKSEGELF